MWIKNLKMAKRGRIREFAFFSPKVEYHAEIMKFITMKGRYSLIPDADKKKNDKMRLQFAPSNLHINNACNVVTQQIKQAMTKAYHF